VHVEIIVEDQVRGAVGNYFTNPHGGQETVRRHISAAVDAYLNSLSL
jgi:hypothetical protein